MGLIECPDCNAEVSGKAAACVHCGCPLTKPQTPVASSPDERPSDSVGECPACGSLQTCDTIEYYSRKDGFFEALGARIFFGVLGAHIGRRVAGKGRYQCLKCFHTWD